jgi:ferredoxin
LGIGDLSRIDIVGEKFEDLAVNDFKLPVTFTRAAMNRAPHGPVKYILEQISPRPRVKKKNCTACGKCVKACPTGAATIVGENAAIDAKRCIRCMCCHEVCRFNAIYLGRPFFGKVTYDMLRAARRM